MMFNDWLAYSTLKTMNGPTVSYELVYCIFPRKIYKLRDNGFYSPCGYMRGHLVRSESMGGVMYHDISELMQYKCDANRCFTED